MKGLRRMAVLVATVAVAYGLVGVASANAAVSVPITGAGPNATFDGTFNLEKFAGQGGQLVAVGTLEGTLTNTATGATRDISRQIRLPVTQQTCEVLELTLGPLDLNLLGLMIHLDQVHLLITADPSGGLLGQLLCSLAGGTNGPLGLQALVTLLNNLLGSLGAIIPV